MMQKIFVHFYLIYCKNISKSKRTSCISNSSVKFFSNWPMNDEIDDHNLEYFMRRYPLDRLKMHLEKRILKRNLFYIDAFDSLKNNHR